MKEDLILGLGALPYSLCLDLLSAAANRAEAAGLAQVMILFLWKQVTIIHLSSRKKSEADILLCLFLISL